MITTPQLGSLVEQEFDPRASTPSTFAMMVAAQAIGKKAEELLQRYAWPPLEYAVTSLAPLVNNRLLRGEFFILCGSGRLYRSDSTAAALPLGDASLTELIYSWGAINPVPWRYFNFGTGVTVLLQSNTSVCLASPYTIT
jgi:hypothetical protein